VRILPATDFPSRLLEPGPRWLQRPGQAIQEFELISGRQLPGRDLFVVRFKGVNDRTAAEALVQHQLLVDANDRPALAEGEFHVLDLQGLEVRLNALDAAIAKVIDLHHGGNDLLEIELHDDGRHCLVPFVDAIVPEVHLEEGWLLLTPPQGLLDP
jgi:16S rRNA processing protein RimM